MKALRKVLKTDCQICVRRPGLLTPKWTFPLSSPQWCYLGNKAFARMATEVPLF